MTATKSALTGAEVAAGSALANTTVVIFTHRTPFSEVPEFVEDEWPAWRNAKRVLVISLAESQERSNRLTPNCTAHAVAPARSVLAKLRYAASAAIHVPWLSEMGRILRAGPRLFGRRLLALATDLQAAGRYRLGLLRVLAREPLAPDEAIVLYSYWLGAATKAGVSLTRHLRTPKVVRVTRAHGSDLYEYAHPENYLPSRRYALTHIDAAYPISRSGADYIVRHWACDAAKVHIARLGIPDHFKGRYPERRDTFTVFSCSYISDLKRVDMIAEAVSRLQATRVHWIHVGGGSGEATLRTRCESFLGGKANLTYELVGSLPHDRTIALLEQTNINVLVNASTSEGIPVSMMEAHCSGIPVIGPNVGGVGEIVDSGINGTMLDPPLTPEILASAIQTLIDMAPRQYDALCRRARASWERKFSADVNYPAFVASVAGLIRSSFTTPSRS
jgi:glycosyltransferase involved in cell wall biosynthesis